MISTIYVLDTDVFIQAAKRYYAFDLVPVFWACLIDYADAGYIESIDRVKSELAPAARDEDELAIWAKGDFAGAFASTNEQDVVDAWWEIVTWADSHPQFHDSAKAHFRHEDTADPWLVAYASVNGCVVVTEEQSAPGSKKVIKIPDVCDQFDVPYVNTFEMLQKLGFCLS